MILNSKSLISLPVRTRSGTAVGKVGSVDLDSETGHLVALRVKTRGIVPGLLDQELVVAWNQVIEITAKEVIVDDAVVPAASRSLAMEASTAAGGVHLSERDAGMEGSGAADA